MLPVEALTGTPMTVKVDGIQRSSSSSTIGR
jgi:hypothetical protein